jgi:fatty acid desaturase
MDHQKVYNDNSEIIKKISDIFSKEEIRSLTERSNLFGFLAIGFTWTIIAVAFIVMAWGLSLPSWQMILVFVLCISVLGGRQLALSILTHEGAHGTLFKQKFLNEKLSDWLCGRPIGLDLMKYRAHHFIHHAKTGTEEDTDISLIKGFPTTRSSLTRKFLRDLSGLTGLKFLAGRILMDAEVLKWTVATDVKRLPKLTTGKHSLKFIKNFFPTFLCNLILYLALSFSGYPQLYLAWIAAYLIPYPLFIRIRSLAEHAATERSSNMFKNTRSTKAGFIARTFVAPIHVNFHIEHHVMASVPWFRLPKMHRLLREKNVVSPPPTYLDVLSIVSSGS